MGAHDQTLARNQFHELVGITQRATENPGDELDLRADLQRRWRLPLDRVDVDVPVRSVRRLGGVGGDDGGRPGDDDLGLDVNVDGVSLLGLVSGFTRGHGVLTARSRSPYPAKPLVVAEFGELVQLGDKVVAIGVGGCQPGCAFEGVACFVGSAEPAQCCGPGCV